MFIKRLTLCNIGPHLGSHSWDFKQGLVGIMGPNGSGKTHLTNALYAAITNDFSRFPGVKEELICDKAGPDDEASITIEAEHNGIPWKLWRGVRPNGSKLWIGDAKKPIAKAGEIQEELEKRLGVNMALVKKFVFVDQWAMFDFLSMTEGDRAKAFQVLCGTEKAAGICKAIDTLLETDTTLTLTVLDNSDELRQQIAELGRQVSAAQVERTTAAKGLMAASAVTQANTIKDKRVRCKAFIEQAGALRLRLPALQKAVETAEATVDDRTLLRNEVQDLVNDLQRGADAAKEQLAKIRQYKTTLARKQQLESMLTAHANELERRGRGPGLHKRDGEYDALVQQKAKLQAEIDRSEAILLQFENEGVVECPTCGTPVSQMDAHLKHVAQQHEQAIVDIAPLSALLLEIVKQRDIAKAYQEFLVRHERIGAKLQGELDGLAQVQDPGGDPAELQGLIDDHAEQVNNLAEANTLLQAAHGTLSSARGTLSASEKQLAGLEQQIRDNTVEETLYTRALAALAAHDAASRQVAALDERLRQLNAQRTNARQALEQLTAQLAQAAKARDFADRLRTIRDEVMHRQALPAYVAQTNLQGLEGDLNKTLDSFGSPFWAETSEGLSFTVHFPGAPARRAERLSGGQKGVLAVAVRSAISKLFDSEIGFMSLDEPTAGVDETNVRFMGDALTAYAATIRGRRQVIIITHHEVLAPAFDQVIQLS